MMCLPRSATTKVKAQEFAGHACFEGRAAANLATHVTKQGVDHRKKKSWGYGVACLTGWVVMCSRVRMDELIDCNVF